jgi:hypothetical protein
MEVPEEVVSAVVQTAAAVRADLTIFMLVAAVARIL